MSLSKEQYDQIMRGYQERQSQHCHELNKRRRQIYALIPEYQQLEQAVASASVERARMLIDGEADSLEEYRRKVAQNAARRAELLREHNFPADYLEPVYMVEGDSEQLFSCPDRKSDRCSNDVYYEY